MARHETSRKPSVAYQHSITLSLPDRNKPPIKALSRLSFILRATHALSGVLAKLKVRRLRMQITQFRECMRVTQSQDSENAQRNLEIAQILRLRGTYICLCMCVHVQTSVTLSTPHSVCTSCIHLPKCIVPSCTVFTLK